jgi:hypothetical protein
VLVDANEHGACTMLQVVCRQLGIDGAARAISKVLYERSRNGYIYDSTYTKLSDMWEVRCKYGHTSFTHVTSACVRVDD